MLTQKDLQRLQAEGKIKGFTRNEPKPSTGGRIVAKHFKKRSRALDYISWNLLMWCNKRCVTLEEEYVFHPERRWKFDFAILSLKVAFEYEGGIFMPKSGHNTAKGIQRDCSKYNSAQQLGWKVLRFTALNYTELITELNKTVENL